MTETQISQIELDKTHKEFRQIHEERRKLLQQWETVIEMMKKRDDDIEENQANLQTVKDQLQECKETIQEKKEFLRQQQASNNELDKKIVETERVSAKFKADHLQSRADLDAFQNELDVIRVDLEKCKSMRSDIICSHVCYADCSNW